jgi:hypothetical protein
MDCGKILEKGYGGYQLNNDGIIIYKNKMCIPNKSSNLIRIITDEIHKMPHFGQPSYQKTIATRIM